MSKISQLFGINPVRRKIMLATAPALTPLVAEDMPSANPLGVTNYSTTTNIAYGNGVWVYAVKNQSFGFYSTNNGKGWTHVTLPATQNFNMVVYGAGLFILTVASSATYYTSPDGVTWTTRSHTLLGALIFENNQFITVSNYTWTSPDGITWTNVGTPPVSASFISYTNGMYMMGNGSSLTVYTSPTGATWTSRTISGTGISSYYYTKNLAVAGGVFVIQAYYFGTTNTILTSPDGVTWTIRFTLPSSANSHVLSLNGICLMLLETGFIYWSPNGATWKNKTASHILSTSYAGKGCGNEMFMTVNPGYAEVQRYDLNAEEIVYEK